MTGERILLLAACPGAVFTLAVWLHREWLAAWGMPLATAVERMQDRCNIARLPLAWVAWAGDAPAGMVSLVEDDLPLQPGRTCCLSSLYVVPPRRRQGLGSRLCQYAVAQAVTLGFGHPALYTAGQESFYRRRGWTITTRTVIAGSDGPQLASFMQIENACEGHITVREAK